VRNFSTLMGRKNIMTSMRHWQDHSKVTKHNIFIIIFTSFKT